MDNTLKDLTINIKKSIDREYNEEDNMEPNYEDDQKVVDDTIISNIENSYDSDYEDIVIDHSDDDILIEPDQSTNIDTIRLVKVKSISDLSDELDNVNKTNVPAIIDLKYIQERRSSEFRKLGSTLNAFKKATNANVILLGSTKNVIVVTPEEIRILKQ